MDLQGGPQSTQKRHIPEWQGQFNTKTIGCIVGVVSNRNFLLEFEGCIQHIALKKQHPYALFHRSIHHKFYPTNCKIKIFTKIGRFNTELKCGGETRVGFNKLFRSCVLGCNFGFRTCELYTRFN